MLYLNNQASSLHGTQTSPASIQPLNNSHRTGPDTFYQWRNFYDETPEAVAEIEDSYEEVKSETRLDKYFLLPGRKNTITRMIDDKVVEVRRMIGTEGPIEEWEQSISSKFPIRRSFGAMIGQYIPRLRGAISSVVDADSLTESWSRKSKFYETNKTRKIMSRNDVKAVISEVEVDGETHKSIALMADRPEPLLKEIKRLGLKPKANTHYGAFLTA